MKRRHVIASLAAVATTSALGIDVVGAVPTEPDRTALNDRLLAFHQRLVDTRNVNPTNYIFNITGYNEDQFAVSPETEISLLRLVSDGGSGKKVAITLVGGTVTHVWRDDDEGGRLRVRVYHNAKLSIALSTMSLELSPRLEMTTRYDVKIGDGEIVNPCLWKLTTS